MLEPLEVAAALEDPAPEVRRRACELAGRLQFVELAPQLTEALGDSSAVVVEAACYALGELEGLCAEGPGAREQEAPVRRARVSGARGTDVLQTVSPLLTLPTRLTRR